MGVGGAPRVNPSNILALSRINDLLRAVYTGALVIVFQFKGGVRGLGRWPNERDVGHGIIDRVFFEDTDHVKNGGGNGIPIGDRGSVHGAEASVKEVAKDCD